MKIKNNNIVRTIITVDRYIDSITTATAAAVVYNSTINTTYAYKRTRALLGNLIRIKRVRFHPAATREERSLYAVQR